MENNSVIIKELEKIKTELSHTTYFNHSNGRDERLVPWEEAKTILDNHIKEKVIEELEKIKTELFQVTYYDHINGRYERLVNWEETKTILDKYISEIKGK